jgi:hypothetical protein
VLEGRALGVLRRQREVDRLLAEPAIVTVTLAQFLAR